MALFKRIQTWIMGAPRDPFSSETRSNIALIAFMAWVGLGADGLSSSAYGPEQAFVALGVHSALAFYLAIATFITVFIIALAYNQVIELFPNGGGGYKVAMTLMGPNAAVVSGSALIIDYVLTIAVSVASGVDALLSFLPLSMQDYALWIKVLAILILLYLNLRGMKESIRILMPIFLGFVITHFLIIIYGVTLQAHDLPAMLSNTQHTTQDLSQNFGWLFVLSLLLRAYSLGGGTYTGIEAVSNNVNHLKEARIKTGKRTMLYMALSLGFTASGIILLYLLWQVQPVEGQTLNAVVFDKILSGFPYHELLLIIILIFEAGLLLVAANTGFMGGPAVLANMALDQWFPKKFYHLSNRLVAQNGIILFGMAALLILLLTAGNLYILVVLYSINVFITFTLSLWGICIYWWRNYSPSFFWLGRLSFSAVGLLVCFGILSIMVLEKFGQGGWLTLLITGLLVAFCLTVKRHYLRLEKKFQHLDEELFPTLTGQVIQIPPLNMNDPTAVFFVGESVGEAMHSLLWVERMFPGHFQNYIFLGAGAVDVGSYGSEQTLQTLEESTGKRLNQLVQFVTEHGRNARCYSVFGINLIDDLVHTALKIHREFPNSVFFGASLILKGETWLSRYLHSKTAEILQKRILELGMQMIIIPLRFTRKASD